MTDRLPRAAEDAALAAEYVLGLLDPSDRAAAERRVRAEPAFAAAVTRWEYHFAGLNDGFAEVPAPDLMPRIEARLFGRPAPQTAGGWWRRFLFGATAATVLAMLVVAVLPPAPPPAAPALVATLAAEGQALVWHARWDGTMLTLTRAGGEPAPEGQAHELWLIAGEAAPVSLGLIGADSLARPLAELPAGATLAVSLEPAGGSPTGAPTGPVLAAGQVAPAAL